MTWTIGKILPNTVVYSQKYNETTFRILSGNDTPIIAVKGRFEVPLDCNNDYFFQGDCTYVPNLGSMKFYVDPSIKENFCVKNIEDPREVLRKLINSFAS